MSGGGGGTRRIYAPTPEAQLVLEWISDTVIENAVFQETFRLEFVRIRVSDRVSGHRPTQVRQYDERRVMTRIVSPSIGNQDRSRGDVVSVINVILYRTVGKA